MLHNLKDIGYMIEKYFSDRVQRFILDEIEDIDIPEEDVFYQVSQKGETPTFELVYMEQNAVIYYRFTGMRKEITTIPLRSISKIRFSEAKLATILFIEVDKEDELKFRAPFKSGKKNILEKFHKNVQQYLVGERYYA